MILAGSTAVSGQKAEFSEQDRETLREVKANTEDLKIRMIQVETRSIETEKRLDQKIDALEKKIDARFGSVDSRMDALQNLLFIVIAGIFGLIGFIVWDRTTANAPFKKRQEELEEKENKVERVLQDFARKNAEMADSIKSVGL